MLNQTRHEVLVLGTIKFSKQHYAHLSFLEKLAFYAKWLDPDSSVFTPDQFNTIIAKQPGLQHMLDAWTQLTKDVNSNQLNYHASKIQDFRTYIQNSLFMSLEDSVDNKSKLSHALLALTVVSRSGFYLAGKSVTTPDPQLVRNVQKIIQAQREDKLKAFKNKFLTLPLKFKRAALKLLSYQRFPQYNQLATWVKKAADHLSRLENAKFQAKFVENLFESYQSDVNRTHIDGLQKSLFNRWGANKGQTKLPKFVAKKLFINPIDDNPGKLSRVRNI